MTVDYSPCFSEGRSAVWTEEVKPSTVELHQLLAVPTVVLTPTALPFAIYLYTRALTPPSAPTTVAPTSPSAR
jgi:hypothetical protein